MSKQRLLKIILGPTAVGKTAHSITLAKQYDSPVISCDSRQMYREMLIGTAAPTEEQMQGVKHYFIRDRSIELCGAGDGGDGRTGVAANGVDGKPGDGHYGAADGRYGAGVAANGVDGRPADGHFRPADGHLRPADGSDEVDGRQGDTANGPGDGHYGAGVAANGVDGKPGDGHCRPADGGNGVNGRPGDGHFRPADGGNGVDGRPGDGGIYTAGKYELEAVALIEQLFEQGHEVLIMCGGSPFYIDAVCNGLDDFPASDMKLRAELMERLAAEGLGALTEQLHSLDPTSWASLEMSNPQRVVRALEVCLMTGRPFSSFKTNTRKQRSFTIEKIGLVRPREELYARIDERAVGMFRDGLVEEAAGLYDKRNLPALQTVGYKEIFEMMDGLHDEKTALELIQRNTRRYAKRQLSWWRRDDSIIWVEA